MRASTLQFAGLGWLLYAAVASGQLPAPALEVGYCYRIQEIDAVKAAGFAYAELRTSEIAALSDAAFEALG